VKKSAWLAFGEVVGLLLLVAIASYLAGKYVESKQPRQPKTEPKAYFGPEAVNQQPTQAPQQVYVNPQPTYREPSTLMGRCPACQGRGYFNDPTICPESAAALERSLASVSLPILAGYLSINGIVLRQLARSAAVAASIHRLTDGAKPAAVGQLGIGLNTGGGGQGSIGSLIMAGNTRK
jgi:hypothetical protein